MLSPPYEDGDSPESIQSAPWAAPRAPLPPHKLAKLANALGVSTPIPIIQAYASPTPTYAPSPILPPSAVSASFDFRRSPTPSVGSSARTYTPAPQSSKYLLHVVPPSHLPHESDYAHENELIPPPPSASGYHSHFRRGILVPVYPTLQSQLAAIAKEYGLPSTVGLVLYLVTSSTTANASMRLGTMSLEDGEPGPRISEDIWRHIWVRVLKADREEPALSAIRTNGLGFGNAAAQSSPSLLQDVMSNPNPLRPLLSPMRTEAPRLMTPSPSTTASHSALSSQSGLDSPDSVTTVSDSGNTDDLLPLPGLSSPAFIPILAKVEFDIDKRKATWYSRWKQTRRAQHQKRAESRLGLRSRAGSRADDDSAEGEGDSEKERRQKPALEELRLVERLQAAASVPCHLRPKDGRLLDADDGYAQLPDSDEEESVQEAEEEEEEEGGLTAKYSKEGSVSGDPLADVFGTDAETWADIRAESDAPRQETEPNPNVVDLALDGAALSALPDSLEDEAADVVVKREMDEVEELLKSHSRPRLSVSIPNSPPTPPSSTKRMRSSSTGSSLSRKHIPPALDLAPSLPNAVNAAVIGTDGSTMRLAYLTEETPSTGSFTEVEPEPSDGETTQRPRRSPLEEKRDGVLFDELNLSIEYDDDDPEDHRKSQVLMMAQLDEIERTLAQFSPRRLAIEDLAADTPTGMPSIASLTPDLRESSTGPTLGLPPALGPVTEESWPAVPYGEEVRRSSHGMPSPPRIAFNGISTEPPKSPFQREFPDSAMSDLETKRALDEGQGALYPPLIPPSLVRNPGSDSPIIPLSPDPFGRFPSDVDYPPLRQEPPPAKKSSALRTGFSSRSTSNASSNPSSRFSMDSVASEEGGKVPTKQNSLMSVKTIKKLWRRTNKSSISGSTSPALPDSGRSSPNSAPPTNGPPPGKRISRTVSLSPLPEQPRSAPNPAMLQPRHNSSMHQLQLHWNQESPYPIHPPRHPSPAVSPIPPTTPPLPTSAPAASDQKNVRKSILKSFKSHSGTLSTSSTSSFSVPRSSNEMPPAAEPRRRKGSVVELSSVMKRASGVSSTMTLVDIPRSPPLPDHLSGGTQSRSASRQSETRMRQQQHPSISSTDSLSVSSRAPSRLNAGASPPRNAATALYVPRLSSDSYDSRPSFDESQFEMVSPKIAPTHTLSYPYHAMDQSMSSAE